MEELETKTIDFEVYWSPFNRFNTAQKKMLKTWQAHYKRLKIRTRIRKGNLWVHLADDKAVFDREIPARDEWEEYDG